MAKKIITESAVEQLQFVFSEIAQTAKALKRLSLEMCEINEPSMIEQMPVIIEALSEKIGWAADLGSKKLGSILIQEGDAEAWMMPPAYHDLAEKMEVSHV